MIRGKHAVAGLLVVAGTGLLGMACAKNESTLFVRDVKQVSGDNCAATADETSPAWLSGVLDVAIRLEYDATHAKFRSWKEQHANELAKPENDPEVLKWEQEMRVLRSSVPGLAI